MMKSYKTDKEKKVGEIIEQIFNESQESTEIKLENFSFGKSNAASLIL